MLSAYNRAQLLLVLALAVSLPAQPPEQARRIFESQCAYCHGREGKGGRGPSLASPRLAHAPTDEALRAVIRTGINGTEMPGAWQLSPREIEGLAAFVRSLGTVSAEPLPGSPEQGSKVYRAKGCASCHIVQGQGSGFGPELSEIGARRSGEYLRESLVKPGAAAPEYFLWVEVVTPDGTAIRGIRVNEDSFTIQLKDANSVFYSFRKSALKDLRKLSNQSPMPSYENTLSAGELDDLVAYLASLRGKP